MKFKQLITWQGIYLKSFALLSILLIPFVSVHADFVDLGTPTIAIYAVSDIDAVKAQMSAAHGIEWEDEVVETKTAILPGCGAKQITFRKTFSKSGAPFLQLIQATPAIGPWSANASYTSAYFGYRVDNVAQRGSQFVSAGFKRVAKVGSELRVYEGIAGAKVALLRSDTAPETPSAYTPQAPIDLGTPVILGYHVDESVRLDVKDQWADATGIIFEDLAFEDSPYEFTAESGAAVPGIYELPTNITASIEVTPAQFAIESIIFDLDPCDCDPVRNPCEFEPWNVTPFNVTNDVVFTVPGTLIDDVLIQWDNAGMEPIMFLDIGLGHSILTYYRGLGGIYYELIDDIIAP